jgi:hypothetical protein
MRSQNKKMSGTDRKLVLVEEYGKEIQKLNA